jgi:hypothetical protein
VGVSERRAECDPRFKDLGNQMHRDLWARDPAAGAALGGRGRSVVVMNMLSVSYLEMRGAKSVSDLGIPAYT